MFGWCESGQFVDEFVSGVEQFLWLVVVYLCFELGEVIWCVKVCDWYLVCVLGVFDRLVIDFFGIGLFFGSVKYDYWLMWMSCVVGRCFVCVGVVLDCLDLCQYQVYYFCELLVNQCWFVVFDEEWFVVIVVQYVGQFFVVDLGQQGWVGNFEVIEMKDWEDCVIVGWVQEFV